MPCPTMKSPKGSKIAQTLTTPAHASAPISVPATKLMKAAMAVVFCTLKRCNSLRHKKVPATYAMEVKNITMPNCVLLNPSTVMKTNDELAKKVNNPP